MCGTHQEAYKLIVSSDQCNSRSIVASCRKLVSQRLNETTYTVKIFKACHCLAGKSLLSVYRFACFLQRNERTYNHIFVEELPAVYEAFFIPGYGILKYPESALFGILIVRFGISFRIKDPSLVRDVFGIAEILKAVGNVRRDPEHSGTHSLHYEFKRISVSRELKKDLHHVWNYCSAQSYLAVDKDIQTIDLSRAPHPGHDVFIAADDPDVTVSVTMVSGKVDDLTEDISDSVIDAGKLSKSDLASRIEPLGLDISCYALYQSL